jgi:hypothetical protein
MMSGLLHAPAALSSAKDPINLLVGDLEVWMVCRRRISLAPTAFRTPELPERRRITIRLSYTGALVDTNYIILCKLGYV